MWFKFLGLGFRRNHLGPTELKNSVSPIWLRPLHMHFWFDRKLQIGATEFDSLWNPSNLGATELWLGLTEFTSLDSKSCFGITEFNKSVVPKCFLWRTKTKFLTHRFCKTLHFVMLIYSASSISIHRDCCQCACQDVWPKWQPNQIWRANAIEWGH